MTKINLDEVRMLKDDLTKNADKTISALTKTKLELNKIKNMESFEGTGAKATKNYITCTHNNLLEIYDNILEDLESNFSYSIKQFSNLVDNDVSCIIDSEYVNVIKTEITSGSKDIYSATKSINNEISSISDITSASKIKTIDFKNEEKEFKKIITDMMRKFEDFISSSSNEIEQSKQFINILNSTQGQVQKISIVPNGILEFKKSQIEEFKEWKEKYSALKTFAKNTKKIDGNVRFLYHLGKKHIEVSYAKNGKLVMKIVNEKAIIKEFKKIKKGGPLFKRYKLVSEWRKGTTSKLLHNSNGRLNSRGIKYYDDWGIEKGLTTTSKVTMKQRLKGEVTSPFTGWKNLTKLGQGMKVLGIAGAVVETGLAGYDNYNDATKNGLSGNKRKISTTVNTGVDMSVSIGGAVAGAKAGALLGTAIGSIFPGPGQIIGGAVGGIIGGIAGSAIAKSATEKIRNGIKKGVNNVLKNGIGKAVNKLGNWAFG